MNSRVVRNVIAALIVVGCTGDSITSPRNRDLLSESPLTLPTRPVVAPAIGVDPVSGASVETDQDDYLPGEIVHIELKGWQPGESVQLHMTELPDTHGPVDTTVTVDGDGFYTGHFYDVQPHDSGSTFTLTATGLSSGSSATVVFTDGIVNEGNNTGNDNGAGDDQLSLAAVTTNVGDLIVAQVTVRGLAVTDIICAPAGWVSVLRTNSTTVISQQIFYKVATASEPGTYTFTFRQSNNCAGSATGNLAAAGGIIAYSGVDTGSPLDGTATGSIGVSATETAPAITTTVNGARVIRFFGVANDYNYSDFSSTNQVYDQDENDGLDIAVAAYDSTQATAGSTNTRTVTISGATEAWIAQTVALKNVIAEKLVILGGPFGAGLGSCVGPFAVQAQNNAGAVANLTATRTINLTTEGPGTFYNSGDSDCSGGADATVSITTNNNTSENFYYKVTGVGDLSHTLTATPSVAGLTAGTTQQVIEMYGVNVPSSSSLAVPAPAVLTGDLLVAQIAIMNLATDEGVCAPAGWTSVLRTNNGGDITQQIFYRFAAGNEAATTYTWNFIDDTSCPLAPENADGIGRILVYSGVNSSNPIDGFGGSSGDGDNSAIAPSVPTSAGNNNARVLRFFVVDDDDVITPPSTALYNHVENLDGGQDRSLAASHSIHATGGTATGTASATFSDEDWVAQTVVLNMTPAASATETTVSGTLDPTKHGATVTITADVELFNSTTAVTTGNVEFRIGSTNCSTGTVLPGGPFPLNGSGQASTTRAFTFSEDDSNIRACYLGATGFQTSNGFYIQDVDKADVSVTVTDNPAGTSNIGQNVTFTVTSLPVQAPGVGTPTGNVRFYDGACGTTQIGSADNTAPYQVTTSALGLGSHTITACYEGDGNFNGASGSVVHDITLNATTTTFGTTGGTTGNPTGSTNNPSVTGQLTFFSATVTSGGSPVTTGQLAFKKGGTSCTDPAAITLETVSHTNSPERGPGYHAGSFRFAAATDPSFTVRACYLGNGTFDASAANPTLTQTVNRAATSTTATDTPDPTTFGQTVSFTGSVAITAPGSSALFPVPPATVFPSGTVNFWKLQGGQTCANASSPTSISLGGGTLPGDGSPTPNVDYANLPASASAHVITACYGGDGNFLPSGASSGTTQHTVNKATSSLTLTTNTPTVFGDAANFTATMGTNPAGNPTGEVRFYLGGTCDTSTGLGTGTALDITGNTLGGSPATAQGTNSTLNFGANTIVACYGGDGNFTGSTHSATHNVTAAATQTVLTSATENGAFGNAITLTATVTVPLNSALDPPGNVQFFFNDACSGTSLGSAAVNTSTNQAVLTIAAASTELQNFTAGTHDLRACYTSSSTNYSGSNGGDTHTVTAAGTTTTASTTTATPQYSDEITLRASVSPASLNGQSQTGNVRFYFGTSVKTCDATDPGAGGTGVIGSDDIVAADNGVSDDAPDYQILDQASATAYKLTACFYSTNSNFGHDGGDANVTVTTEDATITSDPANINSIATAPGGTSVASFQLKFVVKETNPEPDVNAGALAGDIANVAFGVQLQAVGSGANNSTGSCNGGTVAGTGYNGTKTYICTFTNVALDAYEVVSTVSGNYYDGLGSDALSVYDPSAGFVTGGGKFVFPGSTDRVNFGLVFTNPSKKSIRGNLLVIRHMANGDICRAKSNGLEAPAITGNTASWAGKGNYSCTRPDGTQYDGSGNLTITGWVQDNGQGSTATGPDKFWVKVSGALNNNLVMPGTGPLNAASLTGGNIQVPQPGR